MSLTRLPDQLNAWEKRLNKLQARIHEMSQDMCSCQSSVADDLDMRCDELGEIQKELHLAWVDAIREPE